jgi:hypothetical protein
MLLQNITGFVLLATMARCTLAATCSGNVWDLTLSGEMYNNLVSTINTLCSWTTCAGAGAYYVSTNVNGGCDDGGGAAGEAEMVLQPYGCPENCYNALYNILNQCMVNDRSGQTCPAVTDAGSWEYGSEWYWLYSSYYCEWVAVYESGCAPGSCSCSQSKRAAGNTTLATGRPETIMISGAEYNYSYLQAYLSSHEPISQSDVGGNILTVYELW